MKVIIIGGGQVGSYMADLLVKNNVSFIIIEKDPKKVSALASRYGKNCVLFGSGTSPITLASAEAEKADVVTCVTGHDEVNLVASTIAKFEFQVPRVIARVNNPTNAWLYNIGMGVDASINQADIISHMVVEEMSMKSLMTLMQLSRGGYSIIQVLVSEKSVTVGKTIKEIKLPESCIMIAIYHGEDLIIPHGNTMIYPGDKIMLFSDAKVHNELNDLFGATHR